MARKSPRGPAAPVTDEVRRFLSANGKKGGATTRRLIELGRQMAEESGENVEEEVTESLHPREQRPREVPMKGRA